MADSAYGLKIKDASGSACVITPEAGTVITAGRVTMPTGLVDTNKYYTTISLPATINFSDLVVLAQPVVWTVRVVGDHLYSSTRYLYRFCLDSSYTYYSKAIGTGVLSSLTVGNRTLGDETTWWSVMSAFPIVYWEKLGATSGNNIKIFAAMCYLYSQNPGGAAEYDDSDNWAYTISTNGVSEVDYMIMNKRFNY